MTKTLRCLCVIWALMLSGPVLAANLLTNGDFSQADPSSPTMLVPPGWTNVGLEMEGVMPNSMFGTPSYQRIGQPGTVNYYDFGGFGRAFSRVGMGLAQTFPTVAGRPYRLSFAYSSEFSCGDADSANNATHVSVGNLNVDVPVPYAPSIGCLVGYEPNEYTKPWVTKSYTFTATGNSSTLSFTTAVADNWGSNDPLLTGVEVSEISPLLTVNKVLGSAGRLNAADQFTVQIKDSGGNVINGTTNSTTTGNGSTVTAATGTTGVTRLTPSTSYTLAEVMAPGSATSLTYYTASVSCSNANTSGTDVSNIKTLSNSISLAVDDVVTCQITNTPSPPGGISGQVFVDVGRGSGTANDGVLNGSEQPMAGARVQLTNCGGTVYGQTVTDAQGAYSFKTPAVATGASLCVAQTNISGQVSTGASVGNTALPSGSPVSVSGTSYTYTRITDQIAFTWNGTGHSGLNFGDVPQSNWAANGAKTAAPGSTVSYAHTFTAGTAGSVVFSVSSSVATPTLNSWNERIFADVGCTGSLQPGATLLYPPAGTGITVIPQQKVCVIVQEFVPANAPVGYKNDVTVQAAFAYVNANPSLNATFTVNDVTQVDNASLNLFKEVRNVTQSGTFGSNNQAKSGDVLEYRITYANTAPSALSNLTINDTTPAYTSFVSSALGATPTSLTTCTKSTPANPAPAAAVTCATSQSPGGSGALIWRFTGTLAGGATGQVLFQVKVD